MFDVPLGNRICSGYSRAMKRRFLPVGFLLLAGCSNAPVAGFLDCVSPSKARPGIGGDRPPAGGEWGPTLPPRGVLPPPGVVPPPAALP